MMSQQHTLRLERLEERLPLSRPNLILINTDDQRFDTLGVMDFTTRTLAAHGTVFENSFVTSALCCPSRASLLTGQYAHNTGVWFTLSPSGGYENFDDSETLATLLQDSGYRTGLVGKYLNGYSRAVRDSSTPQNAFVPPGWDSWQALLANGYYNYTMSENGPVRWFGDQPQDYQTDVLAEKARDFIFEAEQDDDQPFFLYFAPLAPHQRNPTSPAPRHEGDLDGIPPHRPPSFNEADISDKSSWSRSLSPMTDAQIAKLDDTRQRQLESLLAVDEAIEGIVQTLQTTRELDNTVIVFTSDHGILWGEHRSTAKLNAFDETIRVPLIIFDGRVPAGGQQVDELALNIDLAPTLLQFADVPVPGWMDGESLQPLLDGQASSWRTDFLVQNWIPDVFDANGDGVPDDLPQTSQLAVRSDDWMLISDIDTGQFELYDMLNDPYQLDNVYGRHEYAPIASHHRARLTQLSSVDQNGPSISNLRLLGEQLGSSPLVVRATVSDIMAGEGDVRAPEAFVDVAGRFGEGIPFRPVDGRFDSMSEEVELVLTDDVLSHFSNGNHTLLVHGRDTAFNWGPFRSIAISTRVRYDHDGDLIVLGTHGDDTIRVTQAGHPTKVTVQVNGSFIGTFDTARDVIVYGHAGDDRIETNGRAKKWLYGGDGNDRLIGGSRADVLRGGAGDDALIGNGGSDLLFGGPGDDRLFGGIDQDRLRGGYGNDRLFGGQGDDTLLGGYHDDRIYGEAGNDLLMGQQGVDSVHFSGDEDWTLSGTHVVGAFTDTIHGFERAVVEGGAGDNRINASLFPGRAILRGLGGDDFISGTPNADAIWGGSGSDSISAGAGDDIVHTGTGNDIAIGGLGNDTIYGAAGVQRVFGGAGDDRIWGGDHNDQLFGGSGADRLYGGTGNDMLRGDGGHDTLHGGPGSDTLYGDTEQLGQFVGEANDVLVGGAGDDVLHGGEGDDDIWADSGDDIATGDGGDDVLRGGSGQDRLDGGAGSDRAVGGDGDDYLIGGAGDDVLYGANGADRIYGDSGADRLFGGAGSDIVIGGAENDWLYGGFHRDVLIGGAGFDALRGELDGDILIPGTTTFDQNHQLLTQVQHVWVDASVSLSERVTRILVGAPGVLPLIDTATSLSDDARGESVWSGAGADWFLLIGGDVGVDAGTSDHVTLL